MRGAFQGVFDKWFSPGLAQADKNPAATAGWELERKLAQFRWIIVVLCLCSLPLWGTTVRSLLAGMCLALGLGNWKLVMSLRREFDADRLRCCHRLGTVIDWIGGIVLIVALDPLTPLSFLGPLIALMLVTQLRYGRIGLRLAVIGAMAIITGRAALDVLMRGNSAMPPMERLFIAFVALAGLYYLLDVLQLNAQRIPAERPIQPAPTIEDLGTPLKLTRRYRELLPLLARSELTYQDIARELNIAPETVKSHVKRLSQVLDLKPGGRLPIVLYAETHGLLDGADTPPTAMNSASNDPSAENAPEMYPGSRRNAPDQGIAFTIHSPYAWIKLLTSGRSPRSPERLQKGVHLKLVSGPQSERLGRL